MKKLLLILSVILSGCSCVLSQIPPQVIYAGQGCVAPLPDYRLSVTISDNCQVSEVTQTPTPGFLLTATSMITNVKIRAVDNSGNSSEVTFSVTMLDTIPPIIGIDALTVMTDQQMINLYKNWEESVKIVGLAKWIYDQRWSQGMAFADSAYILSQLHRFNHEIILTDEEYDEYVSIIENQ